MRRLATVVRQRSCGDCTQCCTTMAVEALDKAAHERCPHLGDKFAGCGRYSSRPRECRTFRCAWLSGVGADEQRPDRSGVVIHEGEAMEGAWRGWSMQAREARPGALAAVTDLLLHLADLAEDRRLGRAERVYAVDASGSVTRYRGAREAQQALEARW